MLAPSLLCSALGSTRASTAVLSQIEPAPGAVAAAQALPEDCGRLPPLVAFCASSSDIVRGSLVTVMSAPMRASQNEETDCFTVTAEEPLAFAFDDQFRPSLAAAWARFLAALTSLPVPASTAS